MMFFAPLQAYIDGMIGEFDQIPEERKVILARIGDYVAEKNQSKVMANFNFICTHNSRRSHLAAIWAQTAACWYELDKVQTFSGGTEATAFNPRALAALKRAGFMVGQTYEGANPVYTLRFDDRGPTMVAFSKVYDQEPNPKQGYCAVLTCSSADEACPTVFGADQRIALPYQDPKLSDDTPQEQEIYDERTRQIGRDMFYAFSLAQSMKQQGR